MRPRFLEACQSFQAAEKACWEILLRDLPTGEGHSLDSLSAAMDHTLEQLWALLATGAVREQLTAAQVDPSPLAVEEECGLASYLSYFNAGERALELIAREVERTYPELSSPECERERDELGAAFNVLVHRQLEAVCRRCPLAGECRYGDFKAVAELPRTPLPGAAEVSERSQAGRVRVKRGTRRRRKTTAARVEATAHLAGQNAADTPDASTVVTAGM